MKKLTKFISPVALAVIATTAGAASAAEPEESEEAAPMVCPGMGMTGPEATLNGVTRHDAEARRAPEGVVALIGDALSKVCLSDEQRAAVEKLGQEVSAEEQAVVDARHALRSALLEQLKSGEISEEELSDEIDALVKAREEASPTLREALEELHEILDPGQRAAFVDRIASRMKEFSKSSEGWLDTLAEDLQLSEEQKGEIQDVLAERKPALQKERERATKAFDEFKKDEFSMERIAPVAEVGERTRSKAEGMVSIAKELAEILTPEQAAKLAEKIEGRRAPREPARPRQQIGRTQQPIIVGGGGYRAGGVRGWGGGYGTGYSSGYGGGYSASMSTGYSSGYPLVGGYGPGVW